MIDFKERVCAMVHDLRAKDDEATRLILADLLEEAGRPGVEDRCTKHLRAGKMVLASLDASALDEVDHVQWRMPVKADRGDRLLISNLRRIPYLTCGGVIDPVVYVNLWRVIVKYLTHVQRDDVTSEAERLRHHPDFVPLPDASKRPMPGETMREMLDRVAKQVRAEGESERPRLNAESTRLESVADQLIVEPEVEFDSSRPVITTTHTNMKWDSTAFKKALKDAGKSLAKIVAEEPKEEKAPSDLRSGLCSMMIFDEAEGVDDDVFDNVGSWAKKVISVTSPTDVSPFVHLKPGKD